MIISLLLLLLMPSAWAESLVTKEIADFAMSNGFTVLTLVQLQSSEEKPLQLMQSLSQRNIQTSVSTLDQLRLVSESDTAMFNSDFIFNVVNNQMEWLQVLETCSHIRIQSSLVVTFLTMRDLSNLTVDMSVQLVLFSISTHQWFDVVGIKNTHERLIVNPVEVIRVGTAVSMAQLHYDFHNVTIRDEGLSYRPFFSLDNCNEHGEACQHGGLLGEAAFVIEQMLNLRISFSMNKDGDWGLEPYEAIFNNSQFNYTGVLRSLVLGHTQISIVGWSMLPQRIDAMDMTWEYTDSSFLVIGDTIKLAMDASLLLKPFHPDSWVAIGALMVITTSVMLTVNLTRSKSEASGEVSSRRMLVTSLFLFSMLLNAFYSGALTMFFVNEPNLPFNSLEEAFQAYPKWKIFLPDEESAYLYSRHFLTSKAFTAFWNVAKEDSSLKVATDVDGLHRVMREQAALLIYKTKFSYLKKQPPFDKHSFHFVSTIEKQIHRAAILPFNSPLTPAVSYSFISINEKAIMARLFAKHGGFPSRNRIKEETQIPLSFGDLILSFLLMLVTFVITPVILAAELVAKRLRERKG